MSEHKKVYPLGQRAKGLGYQSLILTGVKESYT